MNSPLRARVIKGRLTLDEPTDLPDGTEVDLAPTQANDSMSTQDVERLNDELDASEADYAAGRIHDAVEVVGELRSQRR